MHAYSDVWSSEGQNGACTLGTYIVAAWLSYLPGDKSDTLPPTFAYRGGCAGSLPSSFSYDLTGLRTAEGYASTNWACCKAGPECKPYEPCALCSVIGPCGPSNFSMGPACPG
jgi:hypothetical protein